MQTREQFDQLSKKYNKIVIWGLRKNFHTHRYIHQAYFKTLKKLGQKVVWLEDEKKNQKYIEPNDLIISADASGRMIPEKNKFEDYNLPVRDDVYYCLHNFKSIFIEKLPQNKLIKLQVYTTGVEENYKKWDEAVFFDSNNNILYQPWGSSLLPEEFREPVFSKLKMVFWIGSIWNNQLKQGNESEINELKQVLKKFEIKFIQLRFVTEWLQIKLVRYSRLAPAIAGKFQAESGYLPCRMFKNISYGQLGFSNVEKFKKIYQDCFISGNSIEELVENVLKLNKDEYIEIVKKQQAITKKYTILNNLLNILKAFENN